MVRDASYKEIVRRYYSSACDYKQGLCDIETSQRAELLMNEQGIDKSFRKVVLPTLEKSKKEQTSVFGIEIETGEVITGKASTLLSAVSSCVLNAIKALSGIADDVLLMSPDVLEPILKIKKENLREDEPTLTIKEVLIALSICATTNELAKKALSNLSKLENAEAHSSCILRDSEQRVLKKLRINFTCEPIFESKQ